MSTQLYPAPQFVIYGKRFLAVRTGKTHPLAELRYYAPSYGSERRPILVDGKFGWLQHDAAAGYRIVVGKPPAPRISIVVRDGLAGLSISDELGRTVVIVTCTIGSGQLRCMVYTGCAAGADGYNISAASVGYGAELELQDILGPLDFARRVAALERAA